MKPYFISLLILVSIGMVPPSITSQAYESDKTASEEYWLNLPSAPTIIVRGIKGQLLTLINYSPVRIIRYQLGWVIAEQGKIKITCKLGPQNTDLAPANIGKNDVHMVGLAYYDQVKECSHKVKAKLAVIEINFEDGSVWKASDVIPASECTSPCAMSDLR